MTYQHIRTPVCLQTDDVSGDAAFDWHLLDPLFEHFYYNHIQQP